jgi:8-oxo-dGTP pyrophosphatase MutT (NUDIX family)
MNNKRVFTQTFGVVGAVIEKDGKILLVQENLPGNPDDAKWNQPAGWIEVGDDPITAIKKEVKEETGYEFTPTHFVGVYSIVRKDLAGFWGTEPHAIKLIFCSAIADYSKNNLLGDTRGSKWLLPEEIYAMNTDTLRDADIKQIVKDYFSGKRYPLDIITHSIQK